MVSVKITQSEYERGLEDCQRNLHGRLTLNKGDPPITSKVLKAKLNLLCNDIKPWYVIPLGKGFYEFKFQSIDDMRKVWAIGAINLKPGLIRFMGWTKDFDPKNQAQSHTQIWVRLMNLPQEILEEFNVV